MSQARDFADLFSAVSTGRRNLIINGAMQVAQRSTSAVAAAGAFATLDRFIFYESTDGAYTSEQSSEAPDGFSNSVKLAVTSADTSLAAGQYSYFFQPVEAQNMQYLDYGTASAKNLTLSFWVRSSKTGTYCIALEKIDSTRYHFTKEYSINAADTWEKKTITISPDSNIKASGGAIVNDNGLGMRVGWWLASGTTYNGATDDTWSSNTNNFVTTNQVNWMDSNSNTFYLTGVQLEVGNSASPFEHHSYGEELALCQRYYVRHNDNDNKVAADGGIFNTSNWNQTSHYIGYAFPTSMRASPSVGYSALSDLLLLEGGGTSTPTDFINMGGNPTRIELRIVTGNFGTTGNAGWLRIGSGGYIDFEAEL